MASTSSLQEKLEDELTCPVCFERFDHETRTPKALPCFHTFCIRCVASLMGAIPKPGSFLCPICKEQAPNHQSAADFKTNLTVASMLDYIDSEDSQTPAGLTNEDVAQPTAAQMEKTMCKTHPEKAVTHVCTECWQVLCTKCLTSLVKSASPSASGHRHNVEEVEDAWPQARKELNKIGSQMTKSLARKQKLDSMRSSFLEKERTKLKDQVREEVDKRIQQLVNEKFRLNREIDKLLCDEPKELEKKEAANRRAKLLISLRAMTKNALKSNSTNSFGILRRYQVYVKQHGLKEDKITAPTAGFTPNLQPVPKNFIGTFVAKRCTFAASEVMSTDSRATAATASSGQAGPSSSRGTINIAVFTKPVAAQGSSYSSPYSFSRSAKRPASGSSYSWQNSPLAAKRRNTDT